MTTDQSPESPDQLRIDLERVEREIAELQKVARDIREQLGDDPGDGPDRAEALRQAEEQEAIAAVLEERRAELQRRLAAS